MKKIIAHTIILPALLITLFPLARVGAQNFEIGIDGSGGISSGSASGGYFFSSCTMPPGTFQDVVCVTLDILSLLIPLLAAAALLVFFWGIVKFIRHAGSEDVREDAKNTMFWGLIGLFVMVSIWGIVIFFYQDLFGWGNAGPEVLMIPLLPFFPEGNN